MVSIRIFCTFFYAEHRIVHRRYPAGAAEFDVELLAEFLRFEKQGDFSFGAFDRIAAVNDVAREIIGQIAPNRARRGFDGIGLTHHGSHGGDNLIAAPDHGRHRTFGDIVDQLAEKRLAFMFGIMLMSQFGGDLQKFHADEIPPAPFEPADNLADQLSLHAVRLDQQQRSFHGIEYLILLISRVYDLSSTRMGDQEP